MTGGQRGSGPRALLLLFGVSLLLCLLLLGWLWPSLRRYRTGTTTSLVAPMRVVPAPFMGTPAGVGSPASTAGGLVMAERSEGLGSVRIEPAPFQPPPTLVVAPPPPPSPVATEAPPAGAALVPAAPPEAGPDAAAAGVGHSDPGGGDSTSGGGGAGALAAPVLEPPLVLKAAWLRYPEGARRRHVEGSVEVRILVAETGGVSAVELVQSAGDTTLDNAALEAAHATQFRPAVLGNEPVAVWYNYRFVFSVPRS